MRGMTGKLADQTRARKMLSSLDLLHLARTAAGRAGGYLRGGGRPGDPEPGGVKGELDFGTSVDRTAEQIISGVALAAGPGGRMVGEGLSPDIVTEGLVWVVDPLDGTTNFLHGYP